MITINDQTITNMIQTLESMNISAMEHQRINTEKHLKQRLQEVQAIYDEREAIRKQALQIYNDNKITMTTFINDASFSRPTLYADDLLKRFAEYLVRQSCSCDNTVRMQRAIDDKQNADSFNQALVDDVIELLHLKDENQHLVEQVEYLQRHIVELESRLGVKPNIIPLDVKKKREPNIESEFPVNLHRD